MLVLWRAMASARVASWHVCEYVGNLPPTMSTRLRSSLIGMLVFLKNCSLKPTAVYIWVHKSASHQLPSAFISYNKKSLSYQSPSGNCDIIICIVSYIYCQCKLQSLFSLFQCAAKISGRVRLLQPLIIVVAEQQKLVSWVIKTLLKGLLLKWWLRLLRAKTNRKAWPTWQRSSLACVEVTIKA